MTKRQATTELEELFQEQTIQNEISMLQLRMKDCQDSEVKPGLEQTNRTIKEAQQNIEKYQQRL